MTDLGPHYRDRRPWWRCWLPARCRCGIRWSRCPDARRAALHRRRHGRDNRGAYSFDPGRGKVAGNGGRSERNASPPSAWLAPTTYLPIVSNAPLLTRAARAITIPRQRSGPPRYGG